MLSDFLCKANAYLVAPDTKRWSKAFGGGSDLRGHVMAALLTACDGNTTLVFYNLGGEQLVINTLVRFPRDAATNCLRHALPRTENSSLTNKLITNRNASLSLATIGCKDLCVSQFPKMKQ